MRFTDILAAFPAVFSLALGTAIPQDFPLQDNNLVKRTDFSDATVNCHNYDDTSSGRVYDGIQYLRGVQGQPEMGPGPGACARVSCDTGTSIWWCNDDSQGKTLDGFGSIADGAEQIQWKCSWGAFGQWTSGQIFHKTGWNVIVRADDC